MHTAQISIGKIMAWIALVAIVVALALEFRRHEAGLAGFLCVTVVFMLPARNHLRLVFAKGPRVPDKALTPRRAGVAGEVLSTGDTPPDSRFS